MFKHIRIDIQDGDKEFVNKYHNQIDTLSSMVIEMVEENPATLLSPVFREMLLDKAKVIKSYHRVVFCHNLHIDNPCEPLQKQYNDANK